jgi:hypothetical protein
MKAYNKIKGRPKVGECLVYKGRYVRFSHDWGDSLQTSTGGHFYLGDGYMSMSGSLNHGVAKKDIELTSQQRMVGVWFFDNNHAGAGQGRDFAVKVRVWKVKKGVKVDYYDIFGEEEPVEYHGEKITTMNGNHQQMIRNLPRIVILNDSMGDVVLEHIYENTGLQFVQKGRVFEAQPTKSSQIVALLMTYNYKTKYYDNMDSRNTLMLKGDHHVGFQVDSICYKCCKENGIHTGNMSKKDRLSC